MYLCMSVCVYACAWVVWIAGVGVIVCVGWGGWWWGGGVEWGWGEVEVGSARVRRLSVRTYMAKMKYSTQTVQNNAIWGWDKKEGMCVMGEEN